MLEVFKKIKGYENRYLVGTFGTVKSLKRNGNVLKQCIGTDGYYMVSLHNKTKKTFRVHKLVSNHFLEKNDKSLIVDHIDGNKLNNKVDNLQFITQRQNVSKSSIKRVSSFIGVDFHKSRKKWRCRIVINGVQKHIGYFNSEIEASNAYEIELKKIK